MLPSAHHSVFVGVVVVVVVIDVVFVVAVVVVHVVVLVVVFVLLLLVSNIHIPNVINFGGNSLKVRLSSLIGNTLI